VAVTFAGNAMAFLAAMAGGMITARALGPAGRGSFALLHTTPDLIVSFVLLGIVQTNVCFVSRGTLPADRALGVSVRAAGIQTLAGLVLFAGAALLYRDQLLGQASPLLIGLSGALIPLGLLQAHWSSLLGAFRRFSRLAFIRALAPALLVAGYLLLLVVFPLGVAGGLAAVVLAAVTVCVLMLAALKRAARGSEPQGGERCEGFWRRYLTYGIKLHASALLWLLIIRLDIYMIKYFLDLESVGYFALASSLAEKLWLITTSTNTVLLPSLAAVENPVERAALAARAGRQVTVVLLPFFIIGILLGEPLIVLLYGAEFRPSATPFMILLGSTLVQAHRSITASFFESSDLALVNVATRSAAFAAKVFLNILLIPAMLMNGAALSSLFAYSFEWVLGTRVFLRRNGLSWRETVPSAVDAVTVVRKLRDLVGPPREPAEGNREGARD
jgi:O-antigen/teichoic acid export membrane protein